jgi:(E)-4-hydroxy-3-methylbut-2-enyl-diphosphate synthase
MVYAAGRQDHTVDGRDMVEHLVELVERKAEQIKARRMPRSWRRPAQAQAAE